MAETRTIEIEVLRYNPEKDREPHFQTFQVPFTDDTSVLQGLQYIKDHLDGSLTFRWSCRMAICGSCGKMVNGKPELSCHTFLRDYYPARCASSRSITFPIVRDLVIDQTDFLTASSSRSSRTSCPRRSEAVAAGEHRADARADAGVLPVFAVHQLPALLRRLPAVRPQAGRSPGPAALALLHRYNADSRDRGLGGAGGGPQRRGRRVGLHAGRLLLRGVSRSTSIPRTPSTRTRSTARWTTSAC